MMTRVIDSVGHGGPGDVRNILLRMFGQSSRLWRRMLRSFALERGLLKAIWEMGMNHDRDCLNSTRITS
jgi:hypothetical protein